MVSRINSSPVPARYVNRELSWLDFNERVLAMALEPDLPILERVKFVAIFSSNLDEFFQVRVAAMKDQVAARVTGSLADGSTPTIQLDRALVRVSELTTHQQWIFEDCLRPELELAGVTICNWTELSLDEREFCREFYENRVFPVLTPLAVDPSHPFPYVSNLALSLAVLVRDPKGSDERFARIKVPALFPRLLAVSGSERFILVEDVIKAFLPTLFPGMDIVEVVTFRLTRNADLALEDEDADDLLQVVEMELRRRRFGRAVRLEVEHGVSDQMLEVLLDEHDLESIDVTMVRGPLDLTCLWVLHAIDRPDLKDDQWNMVTAGRLVAAANSDRSIFSVIRERPLLVHHPYESFATSVEEFIAQSADDPRVQSIKMTLYRTSVDSPIARHLIRAAERGVQVAVLVELKARFDEAVNVTWAREFERAGVHVVYGVVGLKTHAKCVLVVREDADGLRRYAHFGTGNYNSRTARTYEDLGYFTSEPDTTVDAAQLFNHLTGYSRDVSYRRLVVAPEHLRARTIELIRGEAAFGPKGHVVMKLNSLADVQVIDELYAASEAGARIDLVVRGICCLRPGVPGLSENITVRSVIGRYLEHSRVYRFANGDGEGRPLHYIGSADMMERNLDRRVEVLVPLSHRRHQEWLDHVLEEMLAPNAPSFELRPNGSWERIGPETFEPHPQRRLHEWVVDEQTRRTTGRPTR